MRLGLRLLLIVLLLAWPTSAQPVFAPSDPMVPPTLDPADPMTDPMAEPLLDPAMPLAETREVVADLFGDEMRLYFSLPNNYLVFLDSAKGTRNTVNFGANERNDMMMAYMTACDNAMRVKGDGHDDGFTLNLGQHKVEFKAARRDNRSWVVLYVSGPSAEITRFAVPQTWDLKDPKFQELYAIKSGFERLLIKAAL